MTETILPLWRISGEACVGCVSVVLQKTNISAHDGAEKEVGVVVGDVDVEHRLQRVMADVKTSGEFSEGFLKVIVY